MSKMLIWEISIAKTGKKKPFKKLHLTAEYFLQASHMSVHQVYGDGESDDGMFDFDVEIVGIKKLSRVKDIINAHNMDEFDEENEYDDEGPYKLLENKSFPADEVIKFKCSCKNEVVVANYNWPYIQCKSCKRQILHRDLENIAGVWIFTPSN